MCVIRFGREQAEYLVIRLIGGSERANNDYWDDNWLRAEVEVDVGGFRGLLTGNLRTDEFDGFYEQLSRLQQSLEGKAEFVTMEDWLSIRVVGDHRGQVRIYCELRDEPGSGNILTCQLFCDQTFLTPILSQIRRVLDHYPVVGERP